MSDLVERLREHWHGTHDQEESPCEICREAADEITRLRERIAHLERVQEAADAMAARLREDLPVLADDEREQLAAYDAVRKGEG